MVCAQALAAAACVGAYAACIASGRWAALCTGHLRAGYDGPGFSFFDNERGVHDVAVAAFSIDRAPVSNAAVSRLCRVRGIRRAYWCRASVVLARNEEHGCEGWQQRCFDRSQPLDLSAPVVHVSAIGRTPIA